MGLVSAAVLAGEQAVEQTGGVPTFFFGLAGFGVLAVALVVTLMINVDH